MQDQQRSFLFSLGRLTVTVVVSACLGIVFLKIMLITPMASAQGPSPSSQGSTQQTERPWSIFIYANPSSPDGQGLWAFTGRTTDFCEKVEFNATRTGGQPAPFDGKYDDNTGVYIGFHNDFFFSGTNTGTLDVTCILPNGDRLVSDLNSFSRYHFNLQETDINHDLAELHLSATSLSSPHYIIVTVPKALPKSLPYGVAGVGFPYSFRSYATVATTEQNVSLSLFYDDKILGGVNPLTLRIFEWDSSSNRWDDVSEQTNFNRQGFPRRVNKAARRFTTYILGSTPRWCDSFKSAEGLDASRTDNLLQLTSSGKLELEIKSPPSQGVAVSKPYTPTLPLESWDSVTYTSNIPTGANLTVSVLSADGTPLLNNVTSGASLAGINPAVYPSLRLRVEMATDSGQSPELLEWCLSAEPELNQVFLPFIVK